MDRKDSNREFSALSRTTRRDIEGTMQRTHADPRFRSLNIRYLIIRKTKNALFFHGPPIKYDGEATESSLVHTYVNKAGAVKHSLLPVRTTPDFKDPGFKLYWVENEHMYVGYSSLDVATHFARLMYTRGEYINPSFLRQEIDSYFSQELEMTVDKKYMEAAGVVVSETKVTVPVDAMQRFEETKVDSGLYKLFEAVLSQLLSERSSVPTLMGRMGDTAVLSKVSSPINATVHYHKRKRELTPAQWLAASKGRCPTIGFQFPKPGSVKSNGRARTVVALDPYLEAFNRKFWDGVSYKRLTGYCEKPSQLRGDLKWSYDIKSADLKLGPYFRKFCERNFPKYEDALMPLVVGEHGPYRTQALPSGVPHTAIVTNVFTYALCLHLGLPDFQFQGDGILSSVPCESDFLRSNEDRTLNGFRRCGDTVRYVNTHKMAETQYLRPHKVNGELRYRIRYSCLNMLDAIDLDCYPKPKRGLMSADQIRKVCEPSSLSRLEALAVGYNFNYSSANCETTVRNEYSNCTRFYDAAYEVETC